MMINQTNPEYSLDLWIEEDLKETASDLGKHVRLQAGHQEVVGWEEQWVHDGSLCFSCGNTGHSERMTYLF